MGASITDYNLQCKLVGCFQGSNSRGSVQNYNKGKPLVTGLTTWTQTGKVNPAFILMNKILRSISKLQKVSQLRSLSNPMLHYQNENTFSLGKKHFRGYNSYWRWGSPKKMTSSQRRTYFKATHPSPIDSTRKLFFFSEPVSRSSQKNLHRILREPLPW